MIPLYSFYVNYPIASKFAEIIWVLMVIVLTKMKSPAFKLRLKFVGERRRGQNLNRI